MNNNIIIMTRATLLRSEGEGDSLLLVSMRNNAGDVLIKAGGREKFVSERASTPGHCPL